MKNEETKQLLLLVLNVLTENWDRVESEDPDQSEVKWRMYKGIRNNTRSWIYKIAKAKGINLDK